MITNQTHTPFIRTRAIGKTQPASLLITLS